MKLEDQDRDADDPAVLNAEIERIFNKEFLTNLKGSPPIVRLESEYFYQPAFITLIIVLQGCTSLPNAVLILFKQLPMLSPVAPLPLYS
jgi:hypothetical protein